MIISKRKFPIRYILQQIPLIYLTHAIFPNIVFCKRANVKAEYGDLWLKIVACLVFEFSVKNCHNLIINLPCVPLIFAKFMSVKQ